jgi:hypothetical protein
MRDRVICHQRDQFLDVRIALIPKLHAIGQKIVLLLTYNVSYERTN